LQIHGALVQVQGVGVLLLGPSGVGKSETALELVTRGHALVADDVVQLARTGEGLVGRAPEHIRHYLEIRGLGILLVPELYGAQAVVPECAVHLLCRLERDEPGREYERVGLERPRETLADVSLPVVRLPVRPATSMGVIVEAAALDHLMRTRGPSAAERIDRGLAERS
jgi:HPr kinase/phosphorylase